MAAEDTDTGDDLINKLTAASAKIDRLTEASKGAIAQMSKLFSLGSDTSKLDPVGGMTQSFKDLQEVLRGAKIALHVTTKAITDLGSKIPGMGPVVEGFGKVFLKAQEGLLNLADAAIASMEVVASAVDKPTEDMRRLDATMFNLGKQFGGTIGEAEKFADAMKTETASQFAQSLYITRNDMVELMKATKGTSLSLDQMSQSVDTGMGSAKLYTLAIAQGRAMGIELSESVKLINTAMNMQGRSAQEAAKTLGMFSGIASETGLKASTVADTLNSAVSQFTKLGMAADFGRPILEGFGRTMDDMGLGIENATALTQDLTKALGNMAFSYENAYLLTQKGGLDVGGGGGGGVLSSSIGLQAAMLDAEKTGDQGAIASQMVTALRDTLGSFTGGDIVTVQQAAESPELESQFYIQQQMLQTQFGISDPASATRVLDMLADLDDATRSGNKDAQAELEKSLSEEMKGRDKTLDEYEKMNQQLAIQSNLLAVIARPSMQAMKVAANQYGTQTVISGIQTGGKAVRGAAQGASDIFMGMMDKMGIKADDPLRKMMSLSGPTTAGTPASKLLTGQASGAGPLDVDGVLQSFAALNPSFEALGNNMDKLPDQIEQASMLAASKASTEALAQAGFTSRDDLASAIAQAITDAFNAKLNVEVGIKPGSPLADSVEITTAVAGEVGKAAG